MHSPLCFEVARINYFSNGRRNDRILGMHSEKIKQTGILAEILIKCPGSAAHAPIQRTGARFLSCPFCRELSTVPCAFKVISLQSQSSSCL